MRALIQRVSHASVTVEGKVIGEIEHGILAYIGIAPSDGMDEVKRLVDKILTYRIFENSAGKLDENVQQIEGGLLLISQFTLMANTNKGRRPDFGGAMAATEAKNLFQQLIDYAQQQYEKVATGCFGANMQVSATNEGPINLIIDC